MGGDSMVMGYFTAELILQLTNIVTIFVTMTAAVAVAICASLRSKAPAVAAQIANMFYGKAVEVYGESTARGYSIREWWMAAGGCIVAGQGLTNVLLTEVMHASKAACAIQVMLGIGLLVVWYSVGKISKEIYLQSVAGED